MLSDACLHAFCGDSTASRPWLVMLLNGATSELQAVSDWTKIVSRNEPVRAESKTADAREVLRERYRPARARLLFVGEAPPASGLFFYRADSGLYRAIRSAFITAFPDLRSRDFLTSFQAFGCYLVDLCGRPVDRLDKEERKRVCAESEFRLARTIRHLQPKTVITVVRSISTNVERAQQQAGWMGLYVSLPYPGRWRHHQVAFEEAISPILRRQLSNVALPGYAKEWNGKVGTGKGVLNN